MDINMVLRGLDKLFEERRLDEVEDYLAGQLELAVAEDDFGSVISILNEMLGFARETSQFDKCEVYGSQALKIIENSAYKGEMGHATTLLNVANAKRAAGCLQESVKLYEQAEAIYNAKLSKDDMAFASLYNNEALLQEELQDYEKAVSLLLKALDVLAGHPDTEYYQAVSHANLGNALMMLRRMEEAKLHAHKAIALFEPLKVEDSHKGAALAVLGEIAADQGKHTEAIRYYTQAENCILNHIGKNAAYYRVHDRLEMLKKRALQNRKAENGAQLCKMYYETYGVPMLAQQFSQYVTKIATGHVGEGSDCFGFDDEISRDHDYGPGFSMWVTRETYEEIGVQLEKAYQTLPDEFMGYRRVHSTHGTERFGVCVIEDFYERVLGGGHLPKEDMDYLSLEDCYLACAVNGEVYRDDEGIFTGIREKLKKGYPEGVKLLKLAQTLALLGQNGQYNYKRCAKRQEWTSALLAKTEAIRKGLQAVYLLENVYAPHDKWLHRGIQKLNPEVYQIVNKLTECDLKNLSENEELLEQLSLTLLGKASAAGYVTMKGTFLPDIAVEIARRGQLYLIPQERMIDKLVQMEAAEDDEKEKAWLRIWYSFWEQNMLVQRRLDLETEKNDSHDVMQDNAEKQMIIDTIIPVWREWAERYGEKHPEAAEWLVTEKATDMVRRKLESFSDTMLVLYGRYVVRL